MTSLDPIPSLKVHRRKKSWIRVYTVPCTYTPYKEQLKKWRNRNTEKYSRRMIQQIPLSKFVKEGWMTMDSTIEEGQSGRFVNKVDKFN